MDIETILNAKGKKLTSNLKPHEMLCLLAYIPVPPKPTFNWLSHNPLHGCVKSLHCRDDCERLTLGQLAGMPLTGIAEQLLRVAAGAPLEAHTYSLWCSEQPFGHTAKLSAISPLCKAQRCFRNSLRTITNVQQ